MATFNYYDKTQLSTHFNVQEFKCKCGRNHTIIINDNLVPTLEKLFSRLGCGKIIINSGYRCSVHDRAVGGYGSGHHVLGNAADIVCYDKNNKVISSKLVCCAAQDVGFLGIANIDSSYTATHVDVRPNNRWYGNEAVPGGTSGSVTNNFYSYFGIDSNVFNGTTETKTEATPIKNTDNKSVDDIAKEVIAGAWGNGAQRKIKLTEAGYDYTAVQNAVNNLMIDKVARDVIAGKYGVYPKRKELLEAAGYDYQTVQNRVNELLK